MQTADWNQTIIEVITRNNTYGIGLRHVCTIVADEVSIGEEWSGNGVSMSTGL